MYKWILLVYLLSLFSYVEGQNISTNPVYYKNYQDKGVEIYYTITFDAAGRRYLNFYAYNPPTNPAKVVTITFHRPQDKNGFVAVLSNLVTRTTPTYGATGDDITITSYIVPSSSYDYLGTVWQTDPLQPMGEITPYYNIQEGWIDVTPTPTPNGDPASTTSGPGPVGGA